MRAQAFHCTCGAIVVPPNETALKLIEGAGACHVCCLTKTIEFLRQNGDVELLDDILRFTEGYKGFWLHPRESRKETPLYSQLAGFGLDIGG